MSAIASRSMLSATLAVCLTCLAVTGCSPNGDAGPRAPRNPDLVVDSRLVTAMNGFGLELLKRLSKADAGRNVFISPTSIQLALAMTYNGAKGETKDAMARALGLDGMTLEEVNQANADLISLLQNPDPKVELAIANSLWGREGVEFAPDFLARNTDSYEAEVRSIDFTLPGSADTINGWVSKKTREKITQLVDHDSIREALLLLLNAIYFKGKWTLPFEEADTQYGDFTRGDGTTKTLPMMRQRDDFDYLETDQFQAIALPYGDEFVRMLIFLPKAGTTLDGLMGEMTREKLDQWTGELHEQDGTIVLPRFKASYDTSLKPVLTALGMGVAFSDAADLTGMVTPEALATLGGVPFISDVVHKTMLEVNEEGTEAAAATAVIVGVTAVQTQPFEMVVDHPFFLAIQDEPTGAILFMGTIVDPEIER